jgi:hypothetical protein
MASISTMSSWFLLRWLSQQWKWIGPGQSVRLLGVDVGLSGPQPVDEQGVLARVNGAIKRWRRLNMSDAGRVHIANSEVLSHIWYTAVFAPSSTSLNKQIWLAVGGFLRRGTHLHTVRQNRRPPTEAPATAAGAAGTAAGALTT